MPARSCPRSELLRRVATFLTVLVMARLLGVAGFGLLSFGLGLLLSVLSGLGLDARVIQLGSARPALFDRCYGALVGTRVVVSGVVLALTVNIAMNLLPRPVMGHHRRRRRHDARRPRRVGRPRDRAVPDRRPVLPVAPARALVPGAVVAGIVVELVDDVALAVPAGALGFLLAWAPAGRVLDPVLFGNVVAFLRHRPRGAGMMGA